MGRHDLPAHRHEAAARKLARKKRNGRRSTTWHPSCWSFCVAKRPDIRSPLEKTAEKLERRFAEVEALAKDNRRILDIQFKRIAMMQVEIDRLIAAVKRLG